MNSITPSLLSMNRGIRDYTRATGTGTGEDTGQVSEKYDVYGERNGDKGGLGNPKTGVEYSCQETPDGFQFHSTFVDRDGHPDLQVSLNPEGQMQVQNGRVDVGRTMHQIDVGPYDRIDRPVGMSWSPEGVDKVDVSVFQNAEGRTSFVTLRTPDGPRKYQIGSKTLSVK